VVKKASSPFILRTSWAPKKSMKTLENFVIPVPSVVKKASSPFILRTSWAPKKSMKTLENCNYSGL
jgi:hypothetical protein